MGALACRRWRVGPRRVVDGPQLGPSAVTDTPRTLLNPVWPGPCRSPSVVNPAHRGIATGCSSARHGHADTAEMLVGKQVRQLGRLPTARKVQKPGSAEPVTWEADRPTVTAPDLLVSFCVPGPVRTLERRQRSSPHPCRPLPGWSC